MEISSKKPRFLDHGRILKKVLQVFVRLANSIPFIISSILPYYYTNILHSLMIEHTLLWISVRLRQFPLDAILPSWIYQSTISLLKLNLLYMFQFHLPILLTTIMAKSFISVVCAEKGCKVIKLKEMAQWMVSVSNWGNCLIKLVCVSCMSFVSYVVVLNWLASGLLVLWGKGFYVVLYGLGFVAALLKWMELGAVLNLGAAMLKENHGFEVLKISGTFGKGKRVSALVIVVIHFLWAFSTSISRLLMEINFEELVYTGIANAVLYTGLIWMKVV